MSSVTVELGGYAVVWNKDIDISEYELWSNGHAISLDAESIEIIH